MNLKKHFHIVYDTRKFGGKRVAISVNRLPDYIGQNSADFITKKLPLLKVDKVKFKVQNKGTVTIYFK